jgi:hypothetical protein
MRDADSSNGPPTPDLTVNVTVTGARERTGPLTWSQQTFWLSIRRLGGADTVLNGRTAAPLTGVDLDGTLDAIRHLLHRYDVLRTTFVDAGDGTGRQVVNGSGALPVDVYSAGDPGAALAVADAASKAMAGHSFVIAEQWPIRFGIVLADGVPAALAVAIHHVALDFGGVLLVADELHRLLGGGAPLPPPQIEPVDVALFERSADLHAASDRAMRYFRDVFTTNPPSMFDLPVVPAGEPRCPRYSLFSPALAPAAATVARSLRVSSSAVVLAAAAVAVGCYVEHGTITLWAVSANRGGEPLRSVVGTLMLNTAVVVPVDGTGFYATARKAFEASVGAYLNANYDIDDLLVLEARTEHQLGARIDRALYISDGRRAPDPSGPLPSPGELVELSRSARLEPEEPPDVLDLKLHLSVNDAPDGFSLSMMSDSRFVPAETVRQLLTGVEHLIVAAAAGDVARADFGGIVGVKPAVRGPEWIRCRKGFADLGAVVDVWRQTAGPDALVTAEPAADGTSVLVGWCAGAQDIGTLHATARAAVGERLDVRTPDRYVRCRAAPADPDDAGAWRSLPVMETGAGR